jgi:hypothetical protein
MYGLSMRRFDLGLKQIVSEASRALALLDAERLEELARACQALNRDQLERAEAARQARDAAGEMAVFARVLDATRTNMTVVNRLHASRQGAMFYEPAASEPTGWMPTERHDGHD